MSHFWVMVMVLLSGVELMILESSSRESRERARRMRALAPA